ncbi:MAG: alkaline phosphatase family protein [Candidatus Acidoferrales bacterium]
MPRPFDHILIVMFENEYRSYVIQNPYMRWLAGQGIDMANYHGVMHPSQPNYVASIAGELCNISNDIAPNAISSIYQTLVDLMQPEGAGLALSWKAYMEGYPGNPWDLAWAGGDTSQPPPSQVGPYYRKHNAFASFASIQAKSERWQRIVSEAEFWADIERGTLPQYGWFTPNIWNDGHYTTGTQETPAIRHLLVNQVANWLEHVFCLRLKLPGAGSGLPPRTLLVLTFDEADYETSPGGNQYDGPNQIYTVLLGDLDCIRPGRVVHEGYNHYSLLRTVEKNFQLGNLGKNDEGSNWLRFLWGEAFSWSSPEVVSVPPSDPSNPGGFTPVATSGGLALAGYMGAAVLVCQGQGKSGEDELWWSTYDGAHWSAQLQVGPSTSGQIALIACAGILLLLYTDSSGVLWQVTYDITSGSNTWSESQAVGLSGVGSFAVTSFDQDQQLMLVYQSLSDDSLSYLVYNQGAWPSSTPSSPLPEAAQARSGSSLALATLGTTVYLVYQKSASNPPYPLMAMTYETAEYNTTSENNVLGGASNIWSISPSPVSFYPGQRDQPEAVSYSSNGAMAADSLDGGIYLAVSNPAPADELVTTDWVYWTGFGLNGVLTQYAGGNGKEYGTLSEAAWNKLQMLTGAPLRPAPSSGGAPPVGAMAMARIDSRLVLAFGPADAKNEDNLPPYCNSVYYSVGRFRESR